jgi:hypothetical protein
VFARHIKHLAALDALDKLRRIKFRGLSILADVAGVQQQIRRKPKPVDLIQRQFLGPGHILVGRFVEADVAIADLHKTEPGSTMGRRLAGRFGSSCEELRCGYAARHCPKQARACPRHAAQKVSPVDSIRFRLPQSTYNCIFILHESNPPRRQICGVANYSLEYWNNLENNPFS